MPYSLFSAWQNTIADFTLEHKYFIANRVQFTFELQAPSNTRNKQSEKGGNSNNIAIRPWFVSIEPRCFIFHKIFSVSLFMRVNHSPLCL